MIILLALGYGGPAIAAGPVVLREAPGEVTSQIAVRRVEGSATDPAARLRTIRRIEKAAMELCGGSDFSLPEAKAAIRRTPCWQESRADAISQLDNPRYAGTPGQANPE